MSYINQELQTENSALLERLTIFEAENQRLSVENEALIKNLEKQKVLYRKFSDDVIETERIRNESFKSEKRSLLNEKKSLLDENRQLKKDVFFYKSAYEESSKEEKVCEHSDELLSRVKNRFDEINESKNVRRSIRLRVATESSAEESIRSKQGDANAKTKSRNSRAILQVNDKLFHENKKQKLKINSLSATVLLLKKKNTQLENSKKRMIDSKLKSSKEIDELNRLAESTNTKNKYVYTPEILSKLAELSK